MVHLNTLGRPTPPQHPHHSTAAMDNRHLPDPAALRPAGCAAGAAQRLPLCRAAPGRNSNSPWIRCYGQLNRGLARMIHEWRAISRRLAKPPRARTAQLERYFV